MASHDDDDAKKYPDLRLTRRARMIAELLATVSNVTVQRSHRESAADALAWELGPHETVESAWNFAVGVRLQLGYAPNPRECWQQIVRKQYPGGEKLWRIDWLRVAGFLLEDGTENLPEAKRAAPGIQHRVHRLVQDFMRAHGMAPVPRQEIAPDDQPTWDADEYERRYP